MLFMKFTILEVSLIVALSVAAALTRNLTLTIALAALGWVGLMWSERHQKRHHRQHTPKSKR